MCPLVDLAAHDENKKPASKMDYGEFSLLIIIRDTSLDSEAAVAELISEFLKSMVAAAIR